MDFLGLIDAQIIERKNFRLMVIPLEEIQQVVWNLLPLKALRPDD